MKRYCTECKHFSAGCYGYGIVLEERCFHPDTRDIVGHFISPAEARERVDCGREGRLWEPRPPAPEIPKPPQRQSFWERWFDRGGGQLPSPLR